MNDKANMTVPQSNGKRNGPFALSALDYFAAGWTPLYVSHDKTGIPENFTGKYNTPLTEGLLRGWLDSHGGQNVAVRAPEGVVGFDVDHYGDKRGGDQLRELEAKLGPLPPTWRSSARDEPSGIRWYRCPSGLLWPGKAASAIELVTHRYRYAIVAPSWHKGVQGPYRWFTPGGEAFDGLPLPEDFPELPSAWVEHFTGGARWEAKPFAEIGKGDAWEWLRARPAGDMCPRFREKLVEFISEIGEDAHGALTAGVMSFVNLANLGHCGSLAAFENARKIFVGIVTDPDRESGRSHSKARSEFNRSVAGAIAKVIGENYEAGLEPGEACACGFEFSPGVGEGEDFEGEADESDGSWQPIDLGPILSGEFEPELPTVGFRADGVGIFYPAHCHTITSDSEGGKTWLVLSAARDEMLKGSRVVFIDFEDSARGIVSRLTAMGLDRETIIGKFSYINPMESIGRGTNREDLRKVLSGGLGGVPSLVIIDGVTEALTMHGIKPNDQDEIAKFGQMIPRWISREFGSAVVSLDHLTKSKENGVRYASGSVHKLAGVDGAAFTLINDQPFGKGKKGRSTILIAKDRPGELRRHCIDPGASHKLLQFGDLVVDSTLGDVAQISLFAPSVEDSVMPDSARNVQKLKVAACNALVKAGVDLNRTELLQRFRGSREDKNLAISELVDEGYFEAYKDGKSTMHRFVQPFQLVNLEDDFDNSGEVES